ncbi:hypothetical protein CHARACLAT_033187 [Characodon lateralis]|uniref:Major facilitator superfamily (MFS) profile domain-containing protein n=1 Tax=Characodon lateralis TaxID=208331 RepID=A0ABU7DC35_9TELE|nr:hypothetical protein [Characodon lateralis]
MPAYGLSWVMFRWCPRRLSVSSTLFAGGLFILIIQLIPAHLVVLSITFEMMGKFSVSTVFAVVYAYTAELYPTVLRNTAVGACSTASRIGSIIAPYFIYLSFRAHHLEHIIAMVINVGGGIMLWGCFLQQGQRSRSVLMGSRKLGTHVTTSTVFSDF